MGYLLVTLALLLTGTCKGRPSERNFAQLEAGDAQADPSIAVDPPFDQLEIGDLQTDPSIAMDPPAYELEIGDLQTDPSIAVDPPAYELEADAANELGVDEEVEARFVKLATAHDAHRPAAGVAHGPGREKTRNPRYFPLGLPGSGLGGGIGGGGAQRLFGLYPSLFGGTYFSMLGGGVSQGGPFPNPVVPLYG